MYSIYIYIYIYYIYIHILSFFIGLQTCITVYIYTKKNASYIYIYIHNHIYFLLYPFVIRLHYVTARTVRIAFLQVYNIFTKSQFIVFLHIWPGFTVHLATLYSNSKFGWSCHLNHLFVKLYFNYTVVLFRRAYAINYKYKYCISDIGSLWPQIILPQCYWQQCILNKASSHVYFISFTRNAIWTSSYEKELTHPCPPSQRVSFNK